MMQIDIIGKNFEVTSALREFTIEKLDKRLNAHADRITRLHVTFDVEKLVQVAEATIHIAGTDIHARSESDDMYSAVDGLVDKLFKQVIKHKEKLTNHHRGNGNSHDSIE